MTRNDILSLCGGEKDVCSSPANSQELHVLAVDDSFVDRKVIERLLQISAYKVTAVDSAVRALQFLGLDGEENSVGFNGLKVNMIITDYCMPGMTGYDLLKKIKESSTFKEIPVVIMSSENIAPRIDRCLEEGAEEFILKPVKLSDVKRLKAYIKKQNANNEAEQPRLTLKRKFNSSVKDGNGDFSVEAISIRQKTSKEASASSF